jgi:hypothetical protein
MKSNQNIPHCSNPQPPPPVVIVSTKILKPSPTSSNQFLQCQFFIRLSEISDQPTTISCNSALITYLNSWAKHKLTISANLALYPEPCTPPCHLCPSVSFQSHATTTHLNTRSTPPPPNISVISLTPKNFLLARHLNRDFNSDSLQKLN